MGVSGTYDLTLEWNEERMASASDSDQPPIFMALRSQLGLKLKPRAGAQEVGTRKSTKIFSAYARVSAND
jgi:uncharacterized protein (TIGR03435 family)